MAIYDYKFGSGDTAPLKLIYNTDTNLYTLQWYDSAAAAYKDVLQINGNTKEIKVLPISNVDVKIDKDRPKISLKGEETDGMEMSVREDAGNLIVRDEDKRIDVNVLSGLFYALYGDGSDGAITESANVSRGGIILPLDYDDGGYTVTVDGTALAIIAKNSIKISGIIDASGKGGEGGDLTWGHSDGTSGHDGSYAASQAFTGASGIGGAGATDNTIDGGNGETGAGGGGGGTATYNGGNGASAALAFTPTYAHFYPNKSYEDVISGASKCSSGGGGGGAGASEAAGDTGGDGAAGGAGGGLVVLCAPKIIISGTIKVNGIAGNDGDNGTGSNAAGGGGGAGGTGGLILIVTPKLIEDTPTYNLAGGAGGNGGASVGSASAAGAGGNGGDGKVIKIVAR